MKKETSKRCGTKHFDISRFYMFPQFLFQGNNKEKLNNNDRVIYSLILNRYHLSCSKNWIDENGNVFLYYTENTLAEDANISIRTVKNCLQHLQDANLIEIVHQGANRPNIIYLMELQNFPMDDNYFPSDEQIIPSDMQIVPMSNTETKDLKEKSEVVIAKLGKEKLLQHDYDLLVNEFGKTNVDNQIERITNRNYMGCLNVSKIRQWCKEARARPVVKTTTSNYFNFEQRTTDWDEVERLLTHRPLN